MSSKVERQEQYRKRLSRYYRRLEADVTVRDPELPCFSDSELDTFLSELKSLVEERSGVSKAA